MTKSAAATSGKGGKVKGTYGTMYYVQDMAKSVAFFKDKLGAAPSYESPEWTEFPFGGASLCLHLSSGKKTDAEHANGSVILHVDGLKAFTEELRKQKLEVAEVKEVHPGAYSSSFKDPDGNVIGLYEGPKGA